MSFATRCPECHTLFKVSLGQLQVREGQVRCGQCKAVFSGIEHLTAADTEVWQKTKFASEGDQPAKTIKPPESNPSFLSQPSSAKARQTNSVMRLWRSQPKNTKLTLLSLCALLLIQGAWLQRISLLELAPPLAISIGQSSFGTIAFLKQPSASLKLVGSGLDKLSESTLQLDLTLQNNAPLPTRWPHIKVDLTDAQGRPLATRVLSPDEYEWRAPTRASQVSRPTVIAPSQLVELRAYLNIESLINQLPGQTPTGFNLSLFDTSMPLIQ